MNPVAATWQPSSRTRLYGLFGHPVTHSLSPAMQNAAFRAAGIDAGYLAFDVSPEDLGAALAGARAMGLGGINVTVPHKEGALAAARVADPLATLTGAANTLIPIDGGWKAYNTDVAGFVRAIATDLGFRPRGRRGLILGAGGAARAAAVGLAREGAQEITVANRNKERAERLCDELRERLPETRLRPAGLEEAPSFLAPGDLLVSATPLGLQAQGRWPWSLSRLEPGVLVYDMAYRAGAETALIEEARGAGFRAASGCSMLLGQGAEAFALWVGSPAPVDPMREALLRAMAGR